LDLNDQCVTRNSIFKWHRVAATSKNVDFDRKKPVPAVLADHKIPFLFVSFSLFIADVTGIEGGPHKTV
jgi:hypothetical protein